MKIKNISTVLRIKPTEPGNQSSLDRKEKPQEKYSNEVKTNFTNY